MAGLPNDFSPTLQKLPCSVAYFLNQSQHFPKDRKMDPTSAAPELIHHRVIYPDTNKAEEMVLTITMRWQKETFEESAFRHESIKEGHNPWKIVFDIGPKFAEHSKKLISVLDKHSHM